MFLVLATLLMTMTALGDANRFCPVRSPLEGDTVTYRWHQEGGNVVMETTRDHFLYDPKQRKFSLKQGWSDLSRNYSQWLLFDYPKQTLYTIRDQHCTTSALEGPFEFFCLPDHYNASLPSKTWIGGGMDDPYLFLAEDAFLRKDGIAHAASSYEGVPIMDCNLLAEHGEGTLSLVQFENLSTAELPPWTQEEGRAVMEKTTDHFLYDPKQQRFSLKKGWSEVRQDYSLWLLYDFPNQTLYTIKDLHCARSYLREPFEVFCLPVKYDILFGKTWFAQGPQIVYTEEFLYEERNFTVHSLLSMYEDPMMEHRHGSEHDQGTLEMVMYCNLTKVDPKPSDFNPPTYC